MKRSDGFIDLGCGIGAMNIYIESHYRPRFNFGFDRSAAMIKVGKAFIEEKKLKVTLIHQDILEIEHLPLKCKFLFMFDKAFGDRVHEKCWQLIYNSDVIYVIAAKHPPVQMRHYFKNDRGLTTSAQMAGSGEQHTFYFYKRC